MARCVAGLRAGSIPAVAVAGYHSLDVAGREAVLAVAPRRGFTAADAAPGRRAWALAVQLYALRRTGDGGLGDFRALQDLVGPAARLGASAIAISPVHAQFSADPERFSPYSPSSRIQLNVLHAAIDLPPAAARLERERLVNWPEAARVRLAAMREAYRTADARGVGAVRAVPWRERGAATEPRDVRGAACAGVCGGAVALADLGARAAGPG